MAAYTTASTPDRTHATGSSRCGELRQIWATADRRKGDTRAAWRGTDAAYPLHLLRSPAFARRPRQGKRKRRSAVLPHAVDSPSMRRTTVERLQRKRTGLPSKRT